MPAEQCSNCRYYTAVPKKYDNPEHGLCRKYPPVGCLADIHNRFPEVWPNEWCGEYQTSAVPRLPPPTAGNLPIRPPHPN